MPHRRRVVAIALATGSLLVAAAPAAAQSTGCGSTGPGYARLLLADESLRAYYRLGEPAGSTQACDLAGSAGGTYSGHYTLGHSGALTDGDLAARFLGTGTVRVASAPVLNPIDAVTVEAWVQPASIAPSETVLRKDMQYMLRLVEGRVVFRVWTSSGALELLSAPVMRTTYYQHLAAVYDGATMRIYRNGSQIASRTATGRLNATSSSLQLGSSSGTYDFYSGRLDEVAVYGAALAAGSVKDHYTAAIPPSGESFLGCGFGGFGAGSWPTGCWRPYSATSPFNRRLPAAPRVAADSQAVVARLLGFGTISHLEAGLADTADDFGHPSYYSRPSDPLFTLHCYEESWGTCSIEGHQIRIPDAARPAAGGDAHMTVVDQDSGWEYDLYKVRSKPPGGGLLELRWGGRTRIDGLGLSSGATAAQFGNLAGVIRAAELANGRIDHALMATVHCDAGRAVYPARESGRSCAALGEPTADAPPMGAHLQLALTPEQVDALPVPAWKKTILRAMASYGMFVGDTGGGAWGVKLQSGSTFTSFGFPDPLVQFAQDNGWIAYGDVWVGNLRDDVDWARYLRVIDPCVSLGTC
jgi:Concanavalin A-like lectin/glucanases superfamily